MSRAAKPTGPTTTLIDGVRRRLKAPRDPGLAGLRRAGRAALIMPIVFAWTKLAIGDIQIATFAAFGCFAHLVMADFGGPRGPRAVAYITTTLVGAVLVTLGTLASPNAYVAAAAMFVVGLCVQFVGVFGGYIAAAQTALQLAFVLAVSVQAPASAIGGRLTGWCLAGAVSVLGGVFLWPRFERITMRREAARACRALAALIAAERRGPVHLDPTAAHRAAIDAVNAARRSFTATPKRPAGPARRDRAFVELLNELERILALATGPLDRALSAPHPTIEAGHVLADAVIRTLEGSANVLQGTTTEPQPDLAGMEAARRAHRDELDRWAGNALRIGTPPKEVLEALRTDDALRIIAYLTLALGANAVITAGGRPDGDLHLPAETPSGVGIGAEVRRIVGTVRTHLAPTSTILHAALRTGAGLGLAVLLARLLQLDHAFWVVLGTLSALRSNALATGRTTLQAIEGTVLGFVVGAIFIVAVGTHTNVLWVALPITVFLAAYASSTIGFVAGQAAFTVVVITLFNLISPVGWRLGLARIEDVTVGAAISLLAGLLLWPRGARGELRQATATLYQAVAAYLEAGFDQVLQPGSPLRPRIRSIAVDAYDRAAEAFEQYLRERGAMPLNPLIAASFIAPGAYAILAGDLLSGMAAKGYRAEVSDPDAKTIQSQAEALVSGFQALGRQLSTASPAIPTHTPVSEEALQTAAVHGLRRWKAQPKQEQATIAMVTAAEWVHLLAELVATLEAPVATAVAVAGIPWWRARPGVPA